MENRKVKNATPFEYNNIKFKSKLEVYCYKRLIEEGINVKYEEEKFELVPAFVFNNKSIEVYKMKGSKYFGLQRNLVRAITYTPDFTGEYNGKKFIIETKGNPNDVFPIKWKLLKRYLHLRRIRVDLYLPRNKTQVDIVIKEIKNNKDD